MYKKAKGRENIKMEQCDLSPEHVILRRVFRKKLQDRDRWRSCGGEPSPSPKVGKGGAPPARKCTPMELADEPR